MAYGESSVALMDQTRGDHALQSNAVHVAYIYGTTAHGAMRTFGKTLALAGCRIRTSYDQFVSVAPTRAKLPVK